MPTTGSTLKLNVPADYLLTRDFCSYGYFLLAPNRWDPATQSVTRPFDLKHKGRERPVIARIDQPQPKSARSPKGQPIRIRTDRAIDTADRAELKRQITRMLWIEDAGSAQSIKQFHKADPRWKRSGQGRLSRSPSLFEDIIKTVTSCNVAWPNTMNMNELLCWHAGPGIKGAKAFPRASQLARIEPERLRARCKVGYRDKRIVELARLFVKGHIDEHWLTNPETSDNDVRAFLVTLPGIGPYAAHNIMQLLGRFAHVPYDSETVRHVTNILGFKGSASALEKKTRAHYEQFGEHAFRSYWFELLEFYQSKKGPSWTWEPKTTGRSFTQSAFKD